MATEPAPAEINLREPRKRGRDFSALLWLGGWGVATEPEPSASTNEFGLDLGGALTLDGVQQRWTTVKANFGPLLSNLHPLAAPSAARAKRATGSWSARYRTARPPPGSAPISMPRTRRAAPSGLRANRLRNVDCRSTAASY